MNHSTKTFDELTLMELYRILKLRNEVFIVEQHCPYQDCDDLDQVSLHLQMIDQDHLLAYARIVPPAKAYPEPSIGRVITRSDTRGKGLGKRIMELAIDQCRSEYPGKPIRIMAQCYLSKFYKGFGFVDQGEEFLEDGLPHIEMVLF